MSDEPTQATCFVDSNVWLYIFLPGQDTEKAGVAHELVRNERANVVISSQTVNEVVNVIIRHAVMDETEIREFIRRFYARYRVCQITEAVQLNAAQLRERYSLSHWDSLLVSAALDIGASILYSEDMQDGLVVTDQLTIVNPFTSH